ncbi:MAG TPA: hypothetical protein VK116_17385, partial [Planctomycetota bacterium]|nr:hypothetical protein [Planctomycetota bacterium]
MRIPYEVHLYCGFFNESQAFAASRLVPVANRAASRTEDCGGGALTRVRNDPRAGDPRRGGSRA